MRMAEQQCKVKNHNCQIMYPEQRLTSQHMCFCQKNSKWPQKQPKLGSKSVYKDSVLSY